MATDSSTNLNRISWFINWAFSKGWATESIQGACANAIAESHAWLSGKYFDYCVYGGYSAHAGYDWYDIGDTPVYDFDINHGGAYGFFQYAPQDGFAAAGDVWSGFFANGNTQTQANAQLDWWFGSDGLGTGAGYGWISGGNVSYTEDPGANSNVSFSNWARNTNKESSAGQASIFYANFERAGSGQYSGHTTSNLFTTIATWGVNWTPKGASSNSNPSGSTANTGSNMSGTGNNICKQPAQTSSSPTPSNPTNSGQGKLPNSSISCFQAVLGKSVGLGSRCNGSYGQCYGLSQWWAVQCGLSSMSVMTGHEAARTIWSDYPWGSGQFSGFSSGSGVPSNGWRTGDIVCFDYSAYGSIYGHTAIIGVVKNGIPQTMYEQNDYINESDQGVSWGYCSGGGHWGVAIYAQIPWTASNTGIWTESRVTGYVRPKNFPSCFYSS